MAAQVISGVVDNYKFAASGYGIRPGTEDFASELRKEPLFQAMKRADSSAFANLARRYQQRYIEGVPEGIIIDNMRTRTMIPLIRARLPMAGQPSLDRLREANSR